MRRTTTFSMLAAERLPGKARGGALRLLAACVAIWVLGMFSPEITPNTATIVLIIGWSIIGLIVLVLAIGTRRVVAAARRAAARRRRGARHRARAGAAQGGHRAARARVLPLLDADLHRRLALASRRRLQGLPPTPTFSDFFYYAVSTGFISPPGDITALSKGARTATMIELLTGTAALAAYIGSFIDFGPAAARAVVAGGDAPAPAPSE